jgi:hypothetical protein
LRGGNVNAEFQYRVDSTAKEFQLVDSSKLGGKQRFAPQANKRRQNAAARLKQLNARRKEDGYSGIMSRESILFQDSSKDVI